MREFPLDSKYLKGPVLHNFLAKTLPKRKFCFRVTPWVHWVKWLKLWKKNAPRQWTNCPTMFHRFTQQFHPRSSKSCAKFLCSLKKSLNSKRIASVSLTASCESICRRWKPPSFRGPLTRWVLRDSLLYLRERASSLPTPSSERWRWNKKPICGGSNVGSSKVTENIYTPTKTNMEPMEPEKDGFQDPRSVSTPTKNTNTRTAATCLNTICFSFKVDSQQLVPQSLLPSAWAPRYVPCALDSPWFANPKVAMKKWTSDIVVMSTDIFQAPKSTS